ncbi:hypothetical protein CTE07_42000 [Chitinophaga terrae (ex Kim and Jung 2007)]|nr:hypothetical protein CTE07_42000 [Chitinophaga terrae (ex Kim and Jung 2007)]
MVAAFISGILLFKFKIKFDPVEIYSPDRPYWNAHLSFVALYTRPGSKSIRELHAIEFR